MGNLAETLSKCCAPGELFERLEGNRVRCFACANRCAIEEGAAGVCNVRVNQGGNLCVPFGYVSGAQCDPIEKKPFFHVLPGSLAFSFGMIGCNFHCGYCQNWVTSQALRESGSAMGIAQTSPEKLVDLACVEGAEIIVSTYNEPLITAEWSAAIFKRAKAAGLMTGYVSNGYATPETLAYLRPCLDLYKVDLKGFDEHRYRLLGGRLQPVLETIGNLHGMGIWLEIVTLLVPGFNDSEVELSRIAQSICGVSPDIPWHVTAFHKDYKMTRNDNTAPADLIKAADIGRKSGLRFVYAGNLPGRAGNLENTYCPNCGKLLVERFGYRILKLELALGGRCPACAQAVPGRWAHQSATR